MKSKFLITIIFFTAIWTSSLMASNSIQGYVYYHGIDTLPVPDVIVTLKNSNGTIVGTYLTGTDGYYEFNNLAPGTYIATGSKSAPGVGVTMDDALLVLQYIKGRITFNDIQKLAADVDGSGKIDMQDFVMIVKHVHQGLPFPVPNWLFLNKTYIVNGLKDSNPGGLTGTAAGDVGGVFIPGTRLNSLPNYPVTHNEFIKVSTNESFTANIRLNESTEITGSALLINYPGELVSVESVESDIPGLDYFIEENRVFIFFNNDENSILQLSHDENMVTLHCKTSENFIKGSRFTFDIDAMSCQFNNEKAILVSLSTPNVLYNEPQIKLEVFPNPITDNARMICNLPESGNVLINIYDNIGKLIYTMAPGNLDAGFHEFNLTTSALDPGKYVCKVVAIGKNRNLTKSLQIIKTR